MHATVGRLAASRQLGTLQTLDFAGNPGHEASAEELRMRRVAIAVVAVLSVAGVAPAGRAAIIPFCCACIDASDTAQQPDTGGPAGGSTEALFCGAAVNESPEYQALVERCDEADEDGKLICIADKETPQTCPAQLLEERRIVCPAVGPAAAPVMSPLVLAVLALGLVGVGVALTRRAARTR